MSDTPGYELWPAGNFTVRFFVPSRRRDKRLLDPGLIEQQKAKVQAIFQELFGGTAPEESPRIGTWRHDDGSVTREEIRIVESTSTIETLNDETCRKRIESLAADVCRDMDQDCAFVVWGSEAFLISDQRRDSVAPVIRFGQLLPEAQEKMIHLGWMGIHSLDEIIQILSLDGWQEPAGIPNGGESPVIAEHKEGEKFERALREPSSRTVWPRGSLAEGDILLSPEEHGLGLRLFYNNRLHGPKTLYFSDTGATPKTHTLLKCLLCQDIDELADLLSRKDIRSGFFKGYRELLNELQDKLEEDPLFRQKAFGQAQLILGRLMFLKFIEQRGWLGGDRHFLRRQFSERQGNFYKSVLLPLFFEILNNDKRNLEPPELPFINGGLFHPRENELQIDLPDEFFRRVIELFDSYEYTIQETPGSDDAATVDPSMFGKVLETLVEPQIRKTTGIHYTPRPIAYALAFESILSRLVSLTGFPEEQLRRFCSGLPTALPPNKADHLKNVLPQLRIVDPAVGSGALLFTCLEVMMSISEICHERIGTPIRRGEFAWGRICREFVCKCLFGVDISEEAVEIARLRLWLAVAVGDIDPTPLPDLEFNIQQADSLLEDSEIKKQLGVVQLKLDWDERSVIENKYFEAIKKYQAAGVATPQVQHQLLKETEECKRQLLACIRTEAPPVTKDKTRGRKKRQQAPADVPFSWRLQFRPVFLKQDGFDIVIANPPYIRIQNIDSRLKREYRDRWDILREGSADLYYAFIQLALELAAPDGEIAFIMSNFSRTASGASLRKLLSENVTIRRWVDFDDTQVFPTATNYVALLFATKRKRHGDLFPCSCLRDKSWIEQPSTRWIEERDENSKVEVPYGEGPWLTIPKDEAEGLLRMREYPNLLGDLVDIRVGVQTSADMLYIFEEQRIGRKEQLEVYSRGLKRWYKIEPELLKLCIKGARSKSASGSDIYLLWPYGEDAKELTFNVIETKFPHGWKYLRAIEKKLRKRESGKFNDDKWHRFGRPQGIETCMQPKVIVPAILKGGAAFVDKEGKMAFTASGEGGGGAWGLIPKPEISIELELLARYLVSDEVWRYFKAMGFPKKNGWRGVDQSVLVKLPVPEAVLTHAGS